VSERLRGAGAEPAVFFSHSRPITVGAPLACVALAGALLGAAVQSLSGARMAAITPPSAVHARAHLDGPLLGTPVAPRGLAPIRRSHDVVLGERQRLLGVGAVSVVVAFYDAGDSTRGLFGIEAIRALRNSAAARTFHDHAHYVGSDYAWMAGSSWQTYTVAGEPYRCIAGVAPGGESGPVGLCEFRDGDVQGTGTGLGFSLSQVLAMTVDERMQIERRD
jgi:hypothetical protein